MNEIKDYLYMLNEALKSLEAHNQDDPIRVGTGKALIGVGLAAGALKESTRNIGRNLSNVVNQMDQFGKKVNQLNDNLEKFNKSSSRLSLSLVILTACLVLVGALQIFL